MTSFAIFVVSIKVFAVNGLDDIWPSFAGNTSMLIMRRVVGVKDNNKTSSLDVALKMTSFYGLMFSLFGVSMIVVELNSAAFHLV